MSRHDDDQSLIDMVRAITEAHVANGRRHPMQRWLDELFDSLGDDTMVRAADSKLDDDKLHEYERPIRLMLIGPTDVANRSSVIKLFNAAKRVLERRGYQVEVPIEVSRSVGVDLDSLDTQSIYRLNLSILAQVDGVVTLRNWGDSASASFINKTAHHARLAVTNLNEWMHPDRETTTRSHLYIIMPDDDFMSKFRSLIDVESPLFASRHGGGKSYGIDHVINQIFGLDLHEDQSETATCGSDDGSDDGSGDDDKSPAFSAVDDDSVRIRGLNDLTINAVRSEAIRAHLKHHRPDENSGSLLDNGLTILARLAALMEEVGEVADELVPAAKAVGDTQLAMLIAQVQLLGEMARKLTYDGGGEPGLTGSGARVLPPSVDRTKLVKELIQVGNVVLSWAQQIEEGGE